MGHPDSHQPHAGFVEESLQSHAVKLLLEHLFHSAVALHCQFQKLVTAPPAPCRYHAEDFAFALSLPKPSGDKTEVKFDTSLLNIKAIKVRIRRNKML